MTINLPAVLARWFGPPVSVKQSQVFPVWVPDPLKEWYNLAEQWGKLRSASTRVYDVEQLRVSEGKVKFVSDATGDWFWAYGERDADSVYEAELRGEWEIIPESLSEFLVHLTISGTAALAACSRLCSQVPDELLSEILAPVDEVDFGGWRWPRQGHRIFMSETLIADIGPAMDFRMPWRNREGFSGVTVSAVSSGDLGYLDDVPSVKWLTG